MTITDRERVSIRRAQRAMIENLSEDYYCAGWYSGIERQLWNGALSDTYTAEALRVLARLCGTWPTYERDVPLDEWIAAEGDAPESIEEQNV